MHLERVAVIVEDYDSAIEFYVGSLGFELLEDSPSTTNDGLAWKAALRPAYPRWPS